MSQSTTRTYTAEQLIAEAVRRGYRFRSADLSALGEVVLMPSQRLCIVDDGQVPEYSTLPTRHQCSGMVLLTSAEPMVDSAERVLLAA